MKHGTQAVHRAAQARCAGCKGEKDTQEPHQRQLQRCLEARLPCGPNLAERLLQRRRIAAGVQGHRRPAAAAGDERHLAVGLLRAAPLGRQASASTAGGTRAEARARLAADQLMLEVEAGDARAVVF
jgi:hypothetical protein